jgi:hypothetical protein
MVDWPLAPAGPKTTETASKRTSSQVKANVCSYRSVTAWRHEFPSRELRGKPCNPTTGERELLEATAYKLTPKYIYHCQKQPPYVAGLTQHHGCRFKITSVLCELARYRAALDQVSEILLSLIVTCQGAAICVTTQP